MPTFRVYTVDPITFAVLDATTYAADMTNPSYQTSAGPVWEAYYSAKAAYGPLVSPDVSGSAEAELTPAWWHNVTVALESDSTAFDAYYARKSRGWSVASCTGSCATTEICGLRAARAQDNCVVPTPGVHFQKRSEEPAAHRDECGISVARASVASLAVRRDVLGVLEKRVLEKRAEESWI
jgi:sphingomyelin phosphodiesterase